MLESIDNNDIEDNDLLGKHFLLRYFCKTTIFIVIVLRTNFDYSSYKLNNIKK